MPDFKISQLPAASALTGAELIPLVQGGVTKQSLINGVLQTYLNSLYQPLDVDLTAIAAISLTGILARTAAATWAVRSVVGTANQINVVNGDGVAGNPTLSLDPVLMGASAGFLHANAGGLI